MKDMGFKIKLGLLLLTQSFLITAARAQTIQQIQNSFNLYKQTALQEKIFVHTDKTVYMPGEILWFKVYCVDGNTNTTINLSKVVYIDVLDSNDNPVIQAKIAMANGVGSGSLYIPVNVSNGNYTLRAYTSWMKNFPADFYFQKSIIFINPLKSPDAVAKATDPVYDIGFYPEGGELVSGIKSKVAFKASGTNGKGQAITGAVLNQRNDTVVRFSSQQFGMGTFAFTPGINSTYRAVVSVNGKKPFYMSFPIIKPQGTVIALTDDGPARLRITVKSTDNIDGTVYLFAHTRQVVSYAGTEKLANGSAEFLIDKQVLGEGISHLTLFNDNKQPVCERLYFKRPANRLVLSAIPDQTNYQPRKKVSIGLKISDNTGQSQSPDMSIAVYRVDSLQQADKADILSYLWLSADLKGYVESPEYYFTQNSNGDEAADNLMLTQGWSRFEWKNLLANRTPSFTYLPEYEGHLITAKTINTVSGKTAGSVISYLAIPGKRVQLYIAQSDSTGTAVYNTKDFYGPGEIIVQTNENIDTTYRIDVQSPFSEQYAKKQIENAVFNPKIITSLKEHSLAVQVANIYSGKQIKQVLNPVTDSSAFYGKPYKTYKLDDFTRFTTMEEDLREYVSEDNIVNSRGKFQIKVLNDRGFLDGNPLVLVDGIPVFNMNKVFAIDPLKVRKLEVVRERYFYGPADAEGIFSFTTYKGDLGGIELDPKAIVLDYEGLQLHRIFYSPSYNTPERLSGRIPDFRNLLYWSADVTGPISFYTSDQKGKYVGIIQGITKQGVAGSGEFTFEVK